MEPDIIEGRSFVRYDEVKHTQGTKKVLKFYMVDTEGGKHLAAMGEDLGDAHYQYHSVKTFNKFGPLSCHTRQELLMWLEHILKESGGVQEGAHLQGDEAHPEGIYFTSHRCEKSMLPDGRRVSRWLLIDQHGKEHVAVVGIERDTKDGHYAYAAEEPFASIQQLTCSNQAGVFRYLEHMLTHHAAAAGVNLNIPEIARAGVPAVERPSRRPLVLDFGGLQRRARNTTLAAATPATDSALLQRKGRGGGHKKHKTVGIAHEMQAKKLRKLHEDTLAEEAAAQAKHLARLRAAAAEAAAQLEGALQYSLGWLQGVATQEEEAAVQYWRGQLQRLLDGRLNPGGGEVMRSSTLNGQAKAAGTQPWQQQQQQVAAGPWEYSTPYLSRHAVRIALEGLRELSSLFIPVSLMLSAQVIPTVQSFTAHPHPAVAAAAQGALAAWRRRLAGHLHILTSKQYLADPVGQLEADIAGGAVQLPTLAQQRLRQVHQATPAGGNPFLTPLPGLTSGRGGHRMARGAATVPRIGPGAASAAAAAGGGGGGGVPVPSWQVPGATPAGSVSVGGSGLAGVSTPAASGSQGTATAAAAGVDSVWQLGAAGGSGGSPLRGGAAGGVSSPSRRGAAAGVAGAGSPTKQARGAAAGGSPTRHGPPAPAPAGVATQQGPGQFGVVVRRPRDTTPRRPSSASALAAFCSQGEGLGAGPGAATGASLTRSGATGDTGDVDMEAAAMDSADLELLLAQGALAGPASSSDMPGVGSRDDVDMGGSESGSTEDEEEGVSSEEM